MMIVPLRIVPASTIERTPMTDFVTIESVIMQPSLVSEAVMSAWFILQGGRFLACV